MLKGKVAVVTGGMGGIGRAIVARLCREGAHVVPLDLADGALRCDVRDEESVRDAIASVLETHGRIDAAVHAAGISRDAVLWKVPLADWDEVMSVNLRGAFLLMRGCIPPMRAEGRGAIVLIGSINATRGKRGTSVYSASKSGLLGLAKSASRDVGRFGIRVNVVEPGWVRTPLTAALPEALTEKAVGETALGDLAEPDDVASAVAFLCGEGARRITGQVLRVDAGQYM